MTSNLRRSMGLSHATAMVVGIILGASIFVQPSEITRLVPSAGGLLLVWAVAGGLTFCGALVCAELSATFPETGGVYVFLRRIYSPGLAFLWGWAMFWSMHSGIIAAIAVILARYVGYFVPLGEAGVRGVAIGAILLLSLVNYLGVKPGSTVQLVLTAVKVAAIVLMVMLLFWFGGTAHREVAQFVTPPPVPLFAYGLAIAAGLFSFGGWHMVTYAAGETRDPERTIPRALLLGTLIVTGCYVLLNASYLYVLPLASVAQSARVAADATSRALGAGAGGAIAILVIVSSLGSDNGIILAGPRVYYAMARDGLVFRWMGAVHPQRQTPHLAIAAQAVVASLLVATNSYRELFTRVVYTEWLFFALLAAGLFVLHRRGQFTPRYMRWAYPLVPALFVFVSAAIALEQIASNPRGSAIGLAVILLGLPVYLLWRKSSQSPVPSSERKAASIKSEL